jgi:hypothetical protein
MVGFLFFGFVAGTVAVDLPFTFEVRRFQIKTTRPSEVFLRSPPVTIRVPSGETSTSFTGPACPIKVKSRSPVAASHTRAVWSLLTVTIRRLSGENLTLLWGQYWNAR